jgi:hypothetical protein
LLWNGRTADQDFSSEELLFHRVEKFDERGKITAIETIRCPNTSVNRSKYSEPKHALCGQNGRFLSWKVAQFYVRDVSISLTNPNDGTIFDFKVVHNPVVQPDENYAHCEIRAFVTEHQKKRWPPIVEKQFRQIIADAINRELSLRLPVQP